MSEADKEYVVEKVLNKRVANGAVEYLIRWETYGKEYDTWEPAENLGGCKDKIREYETRKSPRSRRPSHVSGSGKIIKRTKTPVSSRRVASGKSVDVKIEPEIPKKRKKSTTPSTSVASPDDLKVLGFAFNQRGKLCVNVTKGIAGMQEVLDMNKVYAREKYSAAVLKHLVDQLTPFLAAFPTLRI